MGSTSRNKSPCDTEAMGAYGSGIKLDKSATGAEWAEVLKEEATSRQTYDVCSHAPVAALVGQVSAEAGLPEGTGVNPLGHAGRETRTKVNGSGSRETRTEVCGSGTPDVKAQFWDGPGTEDAARSSSGGIGSFDTVPPRLEDDATASPGATVTSIPVAPPCAVGWVPQQPGRFPGAMEVSPGGDASACGM